MKGEVRYAVVGFGNSGQVHCKVLSRLKNSNLVAVCDIDKEKLGLAKGIYPGVRCYESMEEMYGSECLDAVSICTPHNSHSYLSQESAKRGIHVLCEKPIATNLKDADSMIETANKSGICLGTIFQHRFEYAPSLLRKEIEEGNLGDILSTSISVKWRKTPEYYMGSWKGKLSESGGGVLINQAIHMIDLARLFNGGVSSVYALTKSSRDYIEVEDNAVALVKYCNGAFGVFDCSTSTNPFIGTGIEVVGTRNTVKLFEGRIVKWGGKSPEEIGMLNKEIEKIGTETWGKKYFGYGHIFQIENFVDSVLRKKSPIVNGYEGRKTLEVVLSLLESARTGKKIDVY